MMQKGIRLTFLAPACIVLAFLLYYKAFLGPVLKESQNADRNSSELYHTMSSVQNITEEITNLSANMTELETQLRDKKADLPDELDPYDIILLLSEADQVSVVKNSLIFLDPVERVDYIVLPVRFHFTSNYNGFLNLLSFLDSLEARPSVSNMQVSAASSGENIHNSMDETGKVIYNLDVEMTLNFYMERN